MLDNIKSTYFPEKIFAFTHDSTKLKLIKYNKSLQNKINIRLINYKIFSGRYIIYEENNQGKEYDSYSDSLTFEGEYLNGKRNGKGKEYSRTRKLIYEGEYLNGKRNGKGKEYDDEGKLIFEGEYSNGKRWNGKGFVGNNHLLYELNNGKGYVKEYSYDRLIYEGEYSNGERNGKGKEYSTFYLTFEGKYLNGKKWNGRLETTEDNNKLYELKNGNGHFIEIEFILRFFFEGEYINGSKNGIGKEYQFGNLIYEGEYLNDLKNG